ncbi:spermidine synthase [Aureimonas endophytica]|nr:spermidine synthase [Aureimonas endophytica]
MIPWVPLGTAPVPGGGELRLMRRGPEYSIMIGGTELMNSRLSGSEEALATLAAERIGPRTAARVLIGGLGMGFTLRAALASLPPKASITVSELVPGVVEWAKGPMADLFGEALSDPRVAIAVEDVAEMIGRARGAYDAILLDVDNGPGGLTRSGNDRLYGSAGLAISLRALTPGGILGVWSQGPDPAFTLRLGRAGFKVEELRVKAGRGRGTKHVLWFATKAARQT